MKRPRDFFPLDVGGKGSFLIFASCVLAKCQEISHGKVIHRPSMLLSHSNTVNNGYQLPLILTSKPGQGDACKSFVQRLCYILC